MSGLSKIEMSAFMGWGPLEDGAYRLEPARTGSTEGVARGKAEAFDSEYASTLTSLDPVLKMNAPATTVSP
jgi:hypothetical protein